METAQLQHKSKEELISFIDELQTHYEQTIESLRHQLHKALRHRFGKRSEKDTGGAVQGELVFDEAVTPDNTPEIEQAEHDIIVPEHKRVKPGRKPLPKDLPRVPVIHDLDEANKTCHCGCALTKIGEETTQQLDIVPAKIQILEHIRYKYACKNCEETILTAQAPKQPIPQSIASPGTLAHVITSKYCDHLPLYRQETLFQRMGIDIARNTLAHWMIKAGELLLPLYKLAQQAIIDYDVAYADETSVQVLNEPGRAAENKAYMWVFSGGSVQQRVVLFHYNPSRAHTVIEESLEDFKGYLHCDGFSGYDAYASDHEVDLVGCWMHCRRKFYDISKTTKSEGVAHKAVKLIAKLYKVEEDIKLQHLTPDKIYAYRQVHTRPILKRFKELIDKYRSKILPKSPLGDALNYAHNQWCKLIRYIDDGRLEIDNGLSERTIKPFVIGRKNHLFFNSVAGVRAGEILYSLIATCKLHSIEPYSYLRYVLTVMPGLETLEQLEQLMPYHIDPAKLTF